MCVLVAVQLSRVSCYLLFWRSQGVLLASQGGPDWADIWRTGLWRPVGLFCAAAVTSILYFSFPLLWFYVSQDLVSSCHNFRCVTFVSLPFLCSLYSVLILFHFCLIFTFPPFCPALFSVPSPSIVFLFLTYSSSAVHLCLSLSSCFFIQAPPPSVSAGSLCWVDCPEEPVCNSSYILGSGGWWGYKTYAPTRLTIPWALLCNQWDRGCNQRSNAPGQLTM